MKSGKMGNFPACQQDMAGREEKGPDRGTSLESPEEICRISSILKDGISCRTPAKERSRRTLSLISYGGMAKTAVSLNKKKTALFFAKSGKFTLMENVCFRTDVGCSSIGIMSLSSVKISPAYTSCEVSGGAKKGLRSLSQGQMDPSGDLAQQPATPRY